MVAIGFSSLKRSVAVSAILCGALAGCASTEQQSSQAGLSPAQTNMPHTNTGSTAVANVAAPATAGTTVASATPVSGETQTTGHQQVIILQDPPTSTVLAKTGRIGPQGVVTTVQAPQSGQLQPASTAVGQAGQLQQNQLQAAQQRFGQPVTTQVANSQGQAAIAAATGTAAQGATAAAAYAASDEPPIPSVVAIPIPNPARPGEAQSMQAVAQVNPTEQSPIMPSPEMVAIQSVIPTPRPDQANSLPVTEIAFAAPAAPAAYADNRPHYDFNFDTTGPTVVPAVLSETYNDNDSAVSPSEKSYITRLIQKYAKLYEVPESLIHRVVHRESRYNPSAYNKAGYFGLMQIKYNTAKSMGYEGSPKGLLDAETNIKYAAKYLQGAWTVSDKKPDDAVALYARGYYFDAKNKGMNDIANGEY